MRIVVRIEKSGSQVGDGFLRSVIRERILSLLEPANAQVMLLFRIQPINAEGKTKKYNRR
jgi:hypothetical protein